jgi:flagellar basal-body rod modification protein FlgD
MDGIDFKLSPQELAERNRELSQLNFENFKETAQGRAPKQALGKEDFLELLTKQLAYQDPMSPMEDKEFIAQMAQFSSLEQMTSMSKSFTKLSEDIGRVTSLISSSGATAALGKQVELMDGDKVVQGVVRAVTRGANPQVLVNGAYYDWDQVSQVFN